VLKYESSETTILEYDHKPCDGVRDREKAKVFLEEERAQNDLGCKIEKPHHQRRNGEDRGAAPRGLAQGRRGAEGHHFFFEFAQARVALHDGV
jgi:hypothetical protein